MHREDYHRSFQRILEGLNQAQRTAVDQVDGPVMVLAGPGTGKTHLLAARIGNILLKTDAGAHNILCLTFTEAGVKAMRERLLRFIGPEAHRIGIYTFHGFCSNLIQQNLHYFGRPGMEPLGELEQIRIIRDLLDQQPQTHPLRLGQQQEYFYEPHLRHLFATIKAENWTTDELEQKIARYREGLPENPDFLYQRNTANNRKGDPKQGSIDQENLRMEKLAAAVALFPDYQAALVRARRYDYGDMIGWVLRAFHDFPSLLRSYQERFQYLLVDEFQDTNGAQEEIVRRLTEYWESPNVFIVGDDDQAIYEFQGARLRAMAEFPQRYAGSTVVTLNESYRSVPSILEAANALIARNTIRVGNRLQDLEVAKRLVPALGPGGRVQSTAAGKQCPPVRLLTFPSQRHELSHLLETLRAWHAAGVPWSEMAVIYARNRQAALLRHALQRAEIPYHSKRRPNVLDSRPVRQLRDLLRYLQAEAERPESGEHLLYRILHFRYFNTQPQDLARINLARIKRKGEADELMSWRLFLQRPDLWPEDLDQPETIVAAANFLEATIARLPNDTLPDFVESVLNDSGLLADTLRQPDRAEALQHLGTFTDFLLAEVARKPRLRLGGLLETLRQMDDNRLELPLRSHLEQADAVLLVTAHSAKGLEFDKVWMLDCAEKSWGDTGRSGQKKFSFPPTVTLTGTENEEEARRRLFFVAMTRARSEVVIACAEQDARGKPQQRVRFVDELVESCGLTFERPEPSAGSLAELTELQLGARDLSLLPGLEAATIVELLAGYRLSVSGLYAYLKCPLRFFYEKLLRVPDHEREFTLYGSALHEALQDYFLRMKRNPDRAFPSKEELLYYFELALGKRRGLLTPKAFEQRLRRGIRELGAYHDRYRSSWTTDVEVELYLGKAEVDGIPLVGMIDRVDVLSDAFVRVVDYKTSAARNQTKIKPPSRSKPHGGDYWRQLTFYKLLYDHQPGNLRRVKDGKISFLLVNPAGEQPEQQLDITKRDTDALRGIMTTAWEGIQNQEFTGCGEPDCEWCRFTQDMETRLPLGEDDGMDDGV
ncbi:ATP-dependent DNA helicase [Lewinella sp. W8]|uniref:ATP-dependent helicase n=1 Tax=Lewinella sp. W8 TaxID=2528208 RepID=UPI00106873AD|nr:ATP-dependent DNA helicase [Lewinella sp. W8]MTB52411.1 AAA family ATPase [Lewinella sp. W8]